MKTDESSELDESSGISINSIDLARFRRPCYMSFCDGDGRSRYNFGRCECVPSVISDMLSRVAWASTGVDLECKSFTAFVPTNDDTAKALSQVKRWASNPDRWLYICGSVGVGKTHLANAAIRQLQSTLVQSAIVDSVAMVDGLISYGAYDPERGRLMECIGVLAIDDIGAEQSGDLRQSILARVVEARIRRALPTIFTSNYTLKELASRNDDYHRIADRLRGQCEVIELIGKSHRG